jgi:hypothetical protein
MIAIAVNRRTVPLEVITYYDPANAISANIGVNHSKAERLKYLKGMDELLSMGLPEWAIENIFQELYGGKAKGTGVNAAGGLLTMDMICSQATLGLHKDDYRRIGTMGFDLQGAKNLELVKKNAAVRAAKKKYMRSKLVQVQTAGKGSSALAIDQ